MFLDYEQIPAVSCVSLTTVGKSTLSLRLHVQKTKDLIRMISEALNGSKLTGSHYL